MTNLEQMRQMDAKEMGKFLAGISEQQMNDEYCEKICPGRNNGTCPVLTGDGNCTRTTEENVVGWLTAEAE